MNNVKKVPAIDFDKELAHKSRIRARNEAPNSLSKVYLKLKQLGKIETIFVFPKGRRPMSYKEWLASKGQPQA